MNVRPLHPSARPNSAYTWAAFDPSRKGFFCSAAFRGVVGSGGGRNRQILSSAISRLVNFWSGGTPGRSFQSATSRFNGHAPASALHSSKLVTCCLRLCSSLCGKVVSLLLGRGMWFSFWPTSVCGHFIHPSAPAELQVRHGQGSHSQLPRKSFGMTGLPRLRSA